jgi:hypothetical protein
MNPICGWSMASFKGQIKTKCNKYELDKRKLKHGIPDVFINAFKDGNNNE